MSALDLLARIERIERLLAEMARAEKPSREN